MAKSHLSMVLLLISLRGLETVSVAATASDSFTGHGIFDHGPFPIAETPYEYPLMNDTELTPSSNNLTTEIRGQLYFPNSTQGPFPVLVFLPGKHPDCRLPLTAGYPALDMGSTDNLGKCPDGLSRVASHLGFAYLGHYFASHGYIVLSVDLALINNKWGIPGDQQLNFVRARIALRTLQKMMELNRSAQMSMQVLKGIDLSGRFDFSHVGMMGHSRGGEAVRNAYNMLMERKGSSDAATWRARLPGVTITAVMEIAPMYHGEGGTKLGVENIPWGMVISGCENDEIDYAHVYLVYQQLLSAKRPNHAIHVYGANHEYFNTEWQTSIPTCFGDQDPLWDINATTFKVSDIFPPAANTSLDLTLLKINGSASQRRTAIFALGAFFRAYVGAHTDPALATILIPPNPLPTDMTGVGRQYFDNTQSVHLFNGTGNVTGTPGVQIAPLRAYAEFMFPAFARDYDNAPIPPPQLAFEPPKKGDLSLGCLEHIENGIHVDFVDQTPSEVLIAVNQIETKRVVAIDIQLARRSSCWFTSVSPSTCAEPREMRLDLQLQTNLGFGPNTTVLLKSRYNMQFARCDAMVFPPEKIGFLPVMFETVRIQASDGVYVSGLKLISQSGGSVIVGPIVAVVQGSSAGTFSQISFYLLFASFLFLSLL